MEFKITKEIVNKSIFFNSGIPINLGEYMSKEPESQNESEYSDGKEQRIDQMV